MAYIILCTAYFTTYYTPLYYTILYRICTITEMSHETRNQWQTKHCLYIIFYYTYFTTLILLHLFVYLCLAQLVEHLTVEVFEVIKLSPVQFWQQRYFFITFYHTLLPFHPSFFLYIARMDRNDLHLINLSLHSSFYHNYLSSIYLMALLHFLFSLNSLLYLLTISYLFLTYFL